MRLLILCAAMILFVSPLFADTIYFKDGKFISGKVLRVTETEVEFSTSEIPFDKQSRSNVLKIVYTNGKTVVFDETATVEEPKEKVPPQYCMPPTFSLNIFGGAGGIFESKISKTERNSYTCHVNDDPDPSAHSGTPYSPVSNNYSPEDGLLHWGLFSDLPITSKDLSGGSFLSLEIRGMYTFDFINQDITDTAKNDTTLGSGTLMKYQSFVFGPVLSFYLTGDTNDWGFTNPHLR